ncbi:hypothetical protein [Mycolicibacterium sp. lyk4-40-TYG-92]|uniref:hypothetical protein n=1 Tax=Mycolicibacterium sp. lyk4-40-TYG-92 TaxID=3040295 RepID=UPI00254A93E7|nr:hypothetical protein [Mycolicibacterium sp. lyk4-40-TYG-92]
MVPEIDHLAALDAGQGNNTRATIKAAIMGERLGSKGASAPTSRMVAPHSYRMCLSVAGQFGHCGVILDDATGGTPQRTLWFPSTDPTMPAERPADPEPLHTNLPRWARASEDAVEIQYGPEEIAQTVVAAHLARQRGEGDALDGHWMLTRLKVAAVLAILRHGMVVSELDWALSAVVMAKSDETRTKVIEHARQAARAKLRERAMSKAVGEQFISDHKLQRAKQAILRWLERDGQLARHDLRRKLKADLRDHFDPAIAELAAEGEIAEASVKNGVGYGLGGEGTRVPEVHPQKQQVNDRVPEVHGVPDATVTDLDSRRSHDSAPRKLTCSQWFTAYIAGLQSAGHTTTKSFAAIEAGMAQGYSKGNIRAAASAHPDVHTIDKKGGTATWSIQRGYRPPVYEGVPEWLDRWLDQQTGDTITPDDAKAAGEAAGHAWHNVRRAAGQSPRIESVPAHGDSRTERVWRIIQVADTEDAS